VFILDLKKQADERDLLLPAADQTLDNLERQGFDKSNKANPGFKNWTLIFGIKSPLMSTPQIHK